MQIVCALAREADRKGMRKAGVHELTTPPGEDLRACSLVTLFYLHASLVLEEAYFLTSVRTEPRSTQTTSADTEGEVR